MNSGLEDLSFLSDLTELERLLTLTTIRDISVVANTGLVRRALTGEDISPLAGPTPWQVLDRGNRVVDIVALESLTRGSVQPRPHAVANNPGLGEGDLVDVRGNPLTVASLETVVSRHAVSASRPVHERLAVHGEVEVLHVGEDIAALYVFTLAAARPIRRPISRTRLRDVLLETRRAQYEGV